MPNFPNTANNYFQPGFSNLSWGVPNNIAFSGSSVNAFSAEGLTADFSLGIDKVGLDCSGSALFNYVGDLRLKVTAKGYINLAVSGSSGSVLSPYEAQLLPGMTFSFTSSCYQGEAICKNFAYDYPNTDNTKFTLSGEVFQFIPLTTLTS